MKKLFAVAAVALLSLPALASAASQKLGFEIFRGRPNAAGQSIYFRLYANNGKIVLQSEAYRNRDGARVGISSIVRNGVGNAQVLQARNGKWYFVVRGANYQVTGASETYTSKSNATRGLHDVAALLRHLKAYKVPVRGI